LQKSHELSKEKENIVRRKSNREISPKKNWVVSFYSPDSTVMGNL
jgi:hypothetical protein